MSNLLEEFLKVIFDYWNRYPFIFLIGEIIAIILAYKVTYLLTTNKKRRKKQEPKPEDKVKVDIGPKVDWPFQIIVPELPEHIKRVVDDIKSTQDAATSKGSTAESLLNHNFDDLEPQFPKIKPEELLETIEQLGEDLKQSSNLPPTRHTNEKSSLCYVNYTSNLKEQTTCYPVYRYPRKGTIVRSCREGAVRRRGYKEESFQHSLEDHFGHSFIVSGDIRLNTGSRTRPYEPDIAMICKSNTSLRIDIEIDEPYAGINRMPIHCVGEDTARDLYFVDRGWIVIRFTEYQVHTSYLGCLSYISKVIKSIDSSFTAPLPALVEALGFLNSQEFWTVIQAQKWESENYRENYLGHTFLPISEEPEIYDKGLNEMELLEERQVTPSYLWAGNNVFLGFNNLNLHLRDERVTFFSEPHIYLIDGVPAPSVSQAITKFFPEFDIDRMAAIRAEELGIATEDVARMWREEGLRAAQEGTYLHEQIERYFLNLEYEVPEEFQHFENFISDHPHLIPYRTEWRIFDENYHIAGTIDLVVGNPNGYDIYDWKRSKRVVDENGNPICNNLFQHGIGQLRNIPDTSFNRYCIQQSIYRYILEKNYDITVRNMYLVVLHPDYPNYFNIQVPYLENEVKYILESLFSNN